MNDPTPPHRTSTLLVGFAVDVSGSMRSSIRNPTGGTLNRFESFRHALEKLTSEARELVRRQRAAGHPTAIDLFVYGFGFQKNVGSVCDLLSLLSLGTELTPPPRETAPIREPYRELEAIARRFGRPGWGDRVQRNRVLTLDEAASLVRRLQEYPELAAELASRLPDNVLLEDVADRQLPSFGRLLSGGHFSGARNLQRDRERLREAEDEARRLANLPDEEFRARLLQEAGAHIQKRLRQHGDTTLPIDEAAERLALRETSQDIEGLLYGDTPMTQALKTIHSRFQKELAARPPTTRPVLFLLSDGDPTDGDPLPEAESLRSLGVTLIACFVTDADVVEPRVLHGALQGGWSQGAQRMFQMASLVEPDSKGAAFLTQRGWTIQPNARLFVQVNHSDVLEEFIRVVLAPLDESRPDLPRGQ